MSNQLPKTHEAQRHLTFYQYAPKLSSLQTESTSIRSQLLVDNVCRLLVQVWSITDLLLCCGATILQGILNRCLPCYTLFWEPDAASLSLQRSSLHTAVEWLLEISKHWSLWGCCTIYVWSIAHAIFQLCQPAGLLINLIFVTLVSRIDIIPFAGSCSSISESYRLYLNKNLRWRSVCLRTITCPRCLARQYWGKINIRQVRNSSLSQGCRH